MQAFSNWSVMEFVTHMTHSYRTHCASSTLYSRWTHRSVHVGGATITMDLVNVTMARHITIGASGVRGPCSQPSEVITSLPPAVIRSLISVPSRDFPAALV